MLERALQEEAVMRRQPALFMGVCVNKNPLRTRVTTKNTKEDKCLQPSQTPCVSRAPFQTPFPTRFHLRQEQVAFAQRLDGELHRKTSSAVIAKNRYGDKA